MSFGGRQQLQGGKIRNDQADLWLRAHDPEYGFSKRRGY